ncbi:MAG: PTS sugar transporter subunit IIC [Erysipelotrichaceae bacterium]
MLIETLLIFLVAFFACSEFFLGTSLIQRPIILGTLTGLIFGQLEVGIIMGATLELAFIGAVSVGAYIPPDMISGTILGVAFAIKAGTGAETALALGLPISTVMLAVNTVCGSPIMLSYIHLMDRNVAKGQFKKFKFNFVLGGYLSFLPRLVIIPAAYFFGSEAIVSMLSNIPEWLQTGINISGGIIPALGFAMLAQMIMNKKVAPYFFIGFFVVKYFEISTTAVAIFMTLYVIIMFMKDKEQLNKSVVIGEESGLDEF